MDWEWSGLAGARVLVVDDEINIASLMTATLNGVGLSATSAISAQDAMLQLSSRDFDVVILDINLPDIDGFDLLTLMRERDFNQPVLFVTAREATQDRIHGLTRGAEDYIVKPFDLDEFVARVQVCLRRVPKFANQRKTRIGPLELDHNSRSVRRADVVISLTPTEFSLLSCLARNEGKVVSRQEILREVWFDGFSAQTTLLDPYISHLRRKVDLEEPHLIHTVRGLGYMIRFDE